MSDLNLGLLGTLIERWRKRADERKNGAFANSERTVATLRQCANELEASLKVLPPAPPQDLAKAVRAALSFLETVDWNDDASERDADKLQDLLEKALSASPPAQAQELRTRARSWLDSATGRTPGWDGQPSKPIELVQDLLAALPPAHGWQPQEQNKDKREEI